LSFFHTFKTNISGIETPSLFTFPFYYDPHPITNIAAKELQEYLELQKDIAHNFGIGSWQEGTPQGKMFGVLVVRTTENKLGYLVAFSGELNDALNPNKFVPRIYDLFDVNSTYPDGQLELQAINKQIEDLESDPNFLNAQETIALKAPAVLERIDQEKQKMKQAKKARKAARTKAENTLNQSKFNILLESLAKESVRDKFLLRQFTENANNELEVHNQEIERYARQIEALKRKRKNTSNRLQREIFDNYVFINKKDEKKTLTEIFPAEQGQYPPAGAGDCAAPKLLQHAFKNNLKPIALGEFWWGAAPSKEIRKHKQFYPACIGRCKPILAHMLKDIPLEENPFTKIPAADKKIEIVFEDDEILVIDKPEEFLSVPGKIINDSVQSRMQNQYSEGPFIIHRLDMSTSGILLLAKTRSSHKFIQSQFIKRSIMKRYVAIVDGILEGDQGIIDLPLILDINDRPRQLVCYEHGKSAKTKWQVIERLEDKTRIHLFPITGRTHQLRVHLSHPKGLNTPIIGDDLYGKKADRLYLHAEEISLIHPNTREKVTFITKAKF